MKFSFDLDGVIYDRTELFSEIAWALKERGHQIGVLSGHKHESEQHVRNKLDRLGFPPIDFYFGRTPEYMPLNGAHRKSDVIKSENIDLHFDDYDFDHPDTIRIFAEKGEHRIARIKCSNEAKQKWLARISRVADK